MSACLGIGNFYYYEFQTYVLAIDRWLNLLGIGFIGFELVLALLAMFAFMKNTPYA